MSVSEPCVLLFGPTVACDAGLRAELERSTVVLNAEDSEQFEQYLAAGDVQVVVLEFSQGTSSDIELVRRLRHRHPRLQIVLVDGNGDRDLTALGFEYGVKDAFAKPYKTELVAERVLALLKRTVNPAKGSLP